MRARRRAADARPPPRRATSCSRRRASSSSPSTRATSTDAYATCACAAPSCACARASPPSRARDGASEGRADRAPLARPAQAARAAPRRVPLARACGIFLLQLKEWSDGTVRRASRAFVPRHGRPLAAPRAPRRAAFASYPRRRRADRASPRVPPRTSRSPCRGACPLRISYELVRPPPRRRLRDLVQHLPPLEVLELAAHRHLVELDVLLHDHADVALRAPAHERVDARLRAPRQRMPLSGARGEGHVEGSSSSKVDAIPRLKSSSLRHCTGSSASARCPRPPPPRASPSARRRPSPCGGGAPGRAEPGRRRGASR